MDKKKDDSCRLQKSSFSPKVGFYLVSTKGGTYHLWVVFLLKITLYTPIYCVYIGKYFTQWYTFEMKKHITLCGSMIFQSKMRDIADILELSGYSVTCPEFTEEEKRSGANTFMDYVESLGGVDAIPSDDPVWRIKGEAIREYKEKIEPADALLICNFDKGDIKNRIGENSFLEMGYAFFVGKPLFVLQGPPYGDSKIEEVLGMTPIFLNGDISRLVIEMKG